MRWRYAVAGTAAAALATLMAGCELDVSLSSEERSYQVSGTIDRLVVTNNSGRVDIVAGTGPIRVTETLSYSTTTRPATSHITDGSTLRLSNDGCQPTTVACDVRYRIQVPAATKIDLTNREGPITLTGLAGDINVASLEGPVDGQGLTSTNAKIRAADGWISLRFLAIPSTVDTGNEDGTIRIRVPAGVGYAVDARSEDGTTRIRVPVDGASAHRITARATGTVTVETA